MKKHIVCFGDSNTHGYCADPRDCADGGIRFNESERWPRRLQALLGEEYLVIEEGLSGRTTCFDDPIHEGLSGIDYITPCLKSHEAVDLLIIMLGTNDTKDRFYASAACIGIGMARLVKKAMNTECWGGKKPNVLVVAPPPIGEGMLTASAPPPWAAFVWKNPGSWHIIIRYSAICWDATSWTPGRWGASSIPWTICI